MSLSFNRLSQLAAFFAVLKLNTCGTSIRLLKAYSSFSSLALAGMDYN
jgi:hypothetical protein